MADYTTTDEVKRFLRINSSGDDDLIAQFVTRASALIDDMTGRWFDVRTATRRFPVPEGSGERMLLLDADLLELTALVNGDGAALDPAVVLLQPLNWPPYFGLMPRDGAALWAGEGEIVVTGRWGYAEALPEPVRHTAVRLAAWLYRQRDTGVAEEVIPLDVTRTLASYRRLRIKCLRGGLMRVDTGWGTP